MGSFYLVVASKDSENFAEAYARPGGGTQAGRDRHGMERHAMYSESRRSWALERLA